MRKPFTFFSAIALFSGAVLIAQIEHKTPFTGTWNLDLTKSSFDPGPPFKSFSITFTRDGTRELDLTGPDRQPAKVSLPRSDGKEVRVVGMENATAVSKVKGRTFHDTWKQNGKVIEDVHGAVSSDGRTLTTTVEATDRQNRPVHNHLIFAKQ